MRTEQHADAAPPAQRAGFATTRWSLVAAAGSEGRRPLAELCARYWYPVYAHCRRCGHAPEAAQVLTQAFFHHVVGERLERAAEHRSGRFRDWLLGELARFVAHDWHGQPVTAPLPDLLSPLPVVLLEKRHQAEGASPTSLELGFRRSFALEVLARAQNRLRAEARQAGREAMYDRLATYLALEPGPGQLDALAVELGSRPLALVVALKRLRQRFRELVDDELAETVASAEALAEERELLLAALRRPTGGA